MLSADGAYALFAGLSVRRRPDTVLLMRWRRGRCRDAGKIRDGVPGMRRSTLGYSLTPR